MSDRTPTTDANPCPSCNGTGDCVRCRGERGRDYLDCKACDNTRACVYCGGTGRKTVILPAWATASGGRNRG